MPVPGKTTIGGHEVKITGLLIGRELFVPTRDIPLQVDEEIDFSGQGLALYDRVGFAYSKGEDSFDVALKDSASGDGFLRFKVPKLNNVKDGGYVWLKLLSTRASQANVSLAIPAVYFGVEDQQQEDGKTNTG